MLQSFTAGIKKYPSLIPLFFSVGVGAIAAIAYPLRLAFRNPDVSWNKKKNPEPWNYYSDKDYKLYDPNNSGPVKSPAPKF